MSAQEYPPAYSHHREAVTPIEKAAPAQASHVAIAPPGSNRTVEENVPSWNHGQFSTDAHRLGNAFSSSRASVETQQSEQTSSTMYHDSPSVASSQLENSIEAIPAGPSLDNSIMDSEGRDQRATSVLSMDDLIAAQALHNLGTDFKRSPSRQQSTGFDSHDPMRGIEGNDRQEPLLSLLTSSHPLLSTAINGSLSAYSSSKSYSPRFRSGAEFVERRLTPVANTVGSVGRRTGVEGGVRWWLGRRGSMNEGGANKRRKVNGSHDERAYIEQGTRTHLLPRSQQRHASDVSSIAESLPAYDDKNRSPNYEDEGALVTHDSEEEDGTQNANWQTRLMLSTSGLGVAMSEESLRSLRYCLSWLRWANVHIGKLIVTLRNMLEEWEQSHQQSMLQDSHSPGRDQGKSTTTTTTTTTTDENDSRSLISHPSSTQNDSSDQTALTHRIQTIKSDVLHTLKQVVDIVSKYAGGALPENARELVRKHLTSLPQRFRVASSTTTTTRNNGESGRGARDGEGADGTNEKHGEMAETVGSAQRVLILAKEGLDMMAQVSGVLDGTIVSAEEWCERLGRKKRDEREGGRETGAESEGEDGKEDRGDTRRRSWEKRDSGRRMSWDGERGKKGTSF
ncbi:MAG: hypothetical protein M1819_005726 [Sarea resinae]|nr:MAG: hypothetical protein M1819_005726 [Sarea resinae]